MMFRTATFIGLAALLASSALAKPAAAVEEAGAVVAPRPKALQNIEIEDKLGAKVPLDLKHLEAPGAKAMIIVTGRSG